MRYLRLGFLAVLAIGLMTVALANRTPVEVRLLTDEMARLLGLQGSLTLPLFIVIFGGIVSGVLIGFIWEWLREHRMRADATTTRRDKERLQREVNRLRENTGDKKDEVLAILEG